MQARNKWQAELDKKQTWTFVYWIVALLLLMSAQDFWQGLQRTEAVPYSEFERALAEGRQR